MKTPFTYYWSRHKTFLIAMTVVIISCAITGLYTWQAIVPIPVFILVLLSRTSRFNPEWEVAKKEFPYVCDHRYDFDELVKFEKTNAEIFCTYCGRSLEDTSINGNGGDQMLGNLS